MQRILSGIVRFQTDAEELNWKEIGGQLKWMLQFGKGYTKRIGFLTGLSIFFMLIGVLYSLVYKYIAEYVWAQLNNIITFVQGQFGAVMERGFWGSLIWLLELIPEWIIWVVIAYLMYKIIDYSWSLFMQFFTLRLTMDLGLGIKRKVFGAILDSDWMSLTEFHSGDLVNRISGDSETVSGFVLNTVPSLIVQVLQFIAAVSVLTYLDWTLTLIAMVGVPMYLFVIRLKARRTRDYTKRSRELASKNISFLNESMANIMVVKSFRLVPEFLKRYRKIHDEVYDLTFEQTRYGIITGAIIGIVGRVVNYAILAFMLYRIIDGHLTIGVLAAFSVLIGQVSGPVNSIMGFIMGSIEISASAERVMKLFELPRDRTQKPEEVERFEKIAADQGGMGMHIANLDFAYQDDVKVIHNADIEVKPGETVALVGASGGGKTTLVRLMLGLLVPGAGDALLTTPRGETLPLSVETREFFSYVPQGNTMFSGTIFDNMLLGRPDATREEMTEALKQACAWEFVEQTPEGLDTKLGERGIGLSEGQAQRLAIARALLRGAPILLLDEATSALDIYTEKAVLDNIFNDKKIKTCILTTHRPSVFTVCDKIYRVQKGKVEMIKSSREEETRF